MYIIYDEVVLSIDVGLLIGCDGNQLRNISTNSDVFKYVLF